MTKEEVILIAVQWWSDKLMSGQPHNNGDNSIPSVIMCMLADIGAKPITRWQLSIFENELTKLLNDDYDKWLVQCGLDAFSIGCDYAPDKVLCVAANRAGIDLNNFPFKTHMRITKSGVSVRDGYRKPYKEIEI
jgi:hypothetical protein